MSYKVFFSFVDSILLFVYFILFVYLPTDVSNFFLMFPFNNFIYLSLIVTQNDIYRYLCLCTAGIRWRDGAILDFRRGYGSTRFSAGLPLKYSAAPKL